MSNEYGKVIVPLTSFIDSATPERDNMRKLLYKITWYRKNKIVKLVELLQKDLVNFYTTESLEDRDKKLIEIMRAINELVELMLKIIDDITQYDRMVYFKNISTPCENNHIQQDLCNSNARKHADRIRDKTHDNQQTNYIY